MVFEVVFWGINRETQKGRLGVSSSQECSHFGLMGCLRAGRGDHVGREADGPTGCVYDFPTSSREQLPDIVDSEKKRQ